MEVDEGPNVEEPVVEADEEVQEEEAEAEEEEAEEAEDDDEEDEEDDDNSESRPSKKRARSPDAEEAEEEMDMSETTDSPAPEADADADAEASTEVAEKAEVEAEAVPEIVPAPVAAPAPSKRDKDYISVASCAAAAQLTATMGLYGLSSLISASIQQPTNLSEPNVLSGALPTLEQVQQAATKSVQEAPPQVHLSKTDSAPQLKILDDRRLTAKGGMRGYRMSRATHGISTGCYYYEVIILEPPSVSEIVSSLPTNTRMGKTLQQQMQQALKEEQEENAPKTSTFGGHVRLGFSMRTGDVQAPVGYDKWSFGIRDIGGAKVHCSKREDHWGGEDFGPGDIVGCAIYLQDSKKDDSSTSTKHPNHIRFFKNGVSMGQFVINKGKREGGVAFAIPDGVYYPAISLYMGASVKVNMGPHFIYQPKKLPAGIKIQPVSNLCPPPKLVEEVVTRIQKEKTFRKPDVMEKFQELVQTEAQILQDAYQNVRKKHILEVKEEREKRSLSTTDLEEESK
jgi:Set1/Ash2 histone methyltransferase complex subunit ASH2